MRNQREIYSWFGFLEDPDLADAMHAGFYCRSRWLDGLTKFTDRLGWTHVHLVLSRSRDSSRYRPQFRSKFPGETHFRYNRRLKLRPGWLHPSIPLE